MARFEQMYQEYSKYPLITKQRMFYETMEELLPSMKVYIVDESGTQKLLPLESFTSSMESGAGTGGAAAGSAGAAAAGGSGAGGGTAARGGSAAAGGSPSADAGSGTDTGTEIGAIGAPGTGSSSARIETGREEAAA